MYNMLGKIVSMIVTIPEAFLGVLVDLLEKITGPNGPEWIQELKRFLRKEPCWIQGQEVPQATEPKPIIYTRCISGDEVITIGATDGTVTPDLSSVFAGRVYNYAGMVSDVQGQARGTVKVAVHEQVVDGNFSQIIGGLGLRFFTVHQVDSFFKDNRKWFRTDGHPTFLPFMVGKKKLVACVSFNVQLEPRVIVHRFSSTIIWDASYRYRFVVPELEPPAPCVP